MDEIINIYLKYAITYTGDNKDRIKISHLKRTLEQSFIFHTISITPLKNRYIKKKDFIKKFNEYHIFQNKDRVLELRGYKRTSNLM